jgi:hypothetical protein
LFTQDSGLFRVLLFKVLFTQDSGLFMVLYRHVSLYKNEVGRVYYI